MHTCTHTCIHTHTHKHAHNHTHKCPKDHWTNSSSPSNKLHAPKLCDTMYCYHTGYSLQRQWTHIYIHLYAHLIRTSQCLGSLTDTSCNFPHKPTVCNTGTGFMSHTVTFLKHFKFGRAAATTSPAPAVGEGQLIFKTTTCKQTEAVPVYCECTCVCVFACVCWY